MHFHLYLNLIVVVIVVVYSYLVGRHLLVLVVFNVDLLEVLLLGQWSFYFLYIAYHL
jgi:hypothetical protein